ncbi:glycosyltransferase family 2 protein [Aestuariibaculum lutulentum]|uniref:Glycosyltransferase n=1 Tax=Aestuariibaculum lutulentum TaxID=2920935 RepID=A0ABS9REI4_9FLAO|nr:glycosyltransferase [Aestuariibaculum lutulentum]MCH4551345.1 glycosyltransferase [Aestuariibaculum lutulentum]
MLSILIPTYNYNVYPLACQLEKQALECNIEFEIICIDDGSQSDLNKDNNKINQLHNSRFKTLSENVGLSNNRNILADASKYNLLLFVDGDSLLPNNNYISNYIEAIKKDTDVVYGGRIHPKTVSSSRKLRWKYGTYREDTTSTQRNKNIYKSTLFNNTLIKKEIFNKIGFDKTIKEYGHEDTIFAFNLKKHHASVYHIDNPVLHNDVDLNTVYYVKTQKALNNLNSIYRTGIIDPNFVTFLNIFISLKKFKLNYLFAGFHVIFDGLLKYNLISRRPYLFLFDLFRITYFSYINLKK